MVKTNEAARLEGYPRPQMVRRNYLLLDGLWKFDVTSPDNAPCFDATIVLPYCPESRRSTVHRHFPEGSILHYVRSVEIPQTLRGGRVLLHVGAADQELSCRINGKTVGGHSGGYTAFTLDITNNLIDGQNQIEFLVTDDLNRLKYPRGKQVKKPGGMWYTPVSGIWQTVWLEGVPDIYIPRLDIVCRGNSVRIDTGLNLPGKVTVEGLGELALEGGKATITPEAPHMWCPEDPYLYHFTVEVGQDRVESYFALRTLEIKSLRDYPRLCLNGKPYFFHGVLDQGYWPEGLLTPDSPTSYAEDVARMKKLGFNTLRKHVKVEAEEFYYQCDVQGMIVWQDMVNNGGYRYLHDTALPTLGLRRGSDQTKPAEEEIRAEFLKTMEEVVCQLKNHPCIVYWTIYNEGWGQMNSDEAYERLKKLDDTRFIDSTSGWFRQKKSDVDSRHVYFRKVHLKADGKKPLVLSEFGGKVCRIQGHSFRTHRAYGYGRCPGPEELNDTVKDLYLQEVLPCIQEGLCASIYTQLCDVEEEHNGLVTFDRRVEKLRPEIMRPIARSLQRAMEG